MLSAVDRLTRIHQLDHAHLLGRCSRGGCVRTGAQRGDLGALRAGGGLRPLCTTDGGGCRGNCVPHLNGTGRGLSLGRVFLTHD